MQVHAKDLGKDELKEVELFY